ncbi:ABC transporter ATP-binding protein [candidate division KSB1 bacterium]|nr:ABC transporter ATP-binding protein [candidate division KSB1 bacterium]
MDRKEIITLHDVSFSYGNVPVLQDVDFSIFERDFLGIIGPNGGGKTTLLKLILGLVTPDRGEITIFGAPPKAGRKFIGYVPQLFNFDFNFPISVLEVVSMGRLRVRKIGRRFTKEDREISLEALRQVGMEAHQNALIGNLSGGQRQRVFIARALATQPRCLLLDEPVASIDKKWQSEFYELLNELNSELTIVLVTHDVSVVVTYIDQIACLNGKVHYHGSTKEGIHKVSELYQCPVQLIAHEVPHRLLGDHVHD